jgi:hypothetical protein
MIPGHLYTLNDDKNFVDVTPDWSFNCPACGSRKSKCTYPSEDSCSVECVYCKRKTTVILSKQILGMFGESIVDSWDRENRQEGF